MNLIQKATFWGDAHHPHWLDYFRMALGAILIAKGISFMADTTAIRELINATRFQPIVFWAIQYIVFCHLVGGFFIFIGLLTRFAVVFQLPILLSALFLVHIRSGFSFLNADLWVAILVLVLLIVFLVVGSGKYSYDERLRTNKRL